MNNGRQSQRHPKVSQGASVVFGKPPTVYRFSKLGAALQQSLKQLQQEGKINEFLQSHIMRLFDSKMTSRFDSIGKPAPFYFEAKEVTRHHLLDGEWEIHCELVKINFEDIYMKIPHLVILADSLWEQPYMRSNLRLSLQQAQDG